MTMDTALIDRVKQRYSEEVASAGPVTDASQVPTTYEAITPEWMTAVLCADTPGARVERVTLDKADDGTSNRRRIFVRYNQTGIDAGLPASVFGKSSQNLHNRITYAILGTGQTETTFYKEFRPLLPIEAPVAYHANFDPDTFNSIILLHDLAGKAVFCDENTPIDFDRASNMVTLLATVHSTFHENDRLPFAQSRLKTWPEHWANIVRLGMEEYSNRGFQAAEGEIPARLFARFEEIWPATLRAVERHKSLPRTLVHGDVHLKNWYVTAGGRMGLSDWQGPTVAHWSRDFAYATSAALKVEDRRKWQEELLRVYLDEMASRGAQVPSFDEALVLVKQQLFTALAYWTVTLRHPPTMPDMQPEGTTREFIKRIATAVDDHDALESFKALA